MNRSSLYVQGRKLCDNNLYVISVVDMEPAGLLVKAYNQMNSQEYFLTPSEEELEDAGISRQRTDLQKLVESLDLKEISGQTSFLSSSLSKIRDAKVIPRGDAAKSFLQACPAGQETLPELLTTALSELCKVKPAGLDAVRWLGEWLLENNPNQPKVEEPIIEEP
eukprot:CAMPEP_0117783368 /NCGR_PEP_ID=MMETSP0948-20121206/4000_1 /TAXON_ID=44440 /ORGANISM="Chattonella subsalsa, Strain CCMP2191" /LENGTH=164 /DNA_ID=CAMNT_0005611777 /DNA_START=125 /DNA_END=619 /DNA_ORIENTATION=-